MAAKDVKMATDNLSCPVCYQLFKNPKYLPCHHSYCEQCLERMQVQSKITCPECRKEAIVPPGGVKDLDSNFFINRLVDEFILKRKVEGEAEVKCDECSIDDPVVAFCPDCTLFLCHVCNEYHKRSIKTCGHKIVPLTELRSKKDVNIQSKPKAMMCKEHDIELLFYCETCDQLVCMYCTVKDHIGHNHDTVKKVVGKHREDLKKEAAPVEGIIKGLLDAYDNIEKMKKKLRQHGDEVSEKIELHYNRVIQKLIEQKEQLKQQVHYTVSQKEKSVITRLEEVEHAQAEVLSIKELNDAIEKSSDQEVLSAKKQMIDRIQQITNKYKTVNFQSLELATLEFIPTKETFPQFGFLYSTGIPGSQNCEVIELSRYSIKGKKSKCTIITKDESNNRCCRGGSRVSVQLGAVDCTTQVIDNDDGSYMALFVPEQVGKMKLSVLVNGQQVKGGPYGIVVKDYRSMNKPNKVVNNDGNMGEPWGIAFGKNGTWAVADYSKHCVYIYNGEDQLICKLEYLGSDSSRFRTPAGVAFDSDGHLYIVEYDNHRVQKCTVDGKFLNQFGGEGSADGKLKDPRGLTIHDHRVYVTDCGNKRISVFQTDGKFLCTIGSGQLGTPYDVTINGNNHLLVTDKNHCVYTFTLDGDYVGRFGKCGSGMGHLKSPYGAAVDMYGFVLVADTDNNRVTIFDKEFKFINCCGSYGSDAGQFVFPYGIAVSDNGDIYVSDRNNKRVQIFSY